MLSVTIVLENVLYSEIGKIVLESTKTTPNKQRLQRLFEVLHEEQKRLIDEAVDFDSLPNKNIIRQIAELELTIVAVDNYIAELDEG